MWRSLTALPVLAAAVVVIAGCGGSDDPEPVRPKPPADARPSRQVASTAPPLTRRMVGHGFSFPSGLVQEPGPGGRVLVVEQRGTARWLVDGRPAPGQPFLDLRAIVRHKEEQGLLGLAFLPDYRKDPRVAVHYTDLKGNTRVVVYRVHDGYVDPLSADEILFTEQKYANNNGGTITVGPDKQLYLGLGDGGSAYDPSQNGQNLKSQLGKVLRYDLSVERPPPPPTPTTTTPSVADVAAEARENARTEAARWQVVAYGLRNPWRLDFDARTGDLWISDAGRDASQQQAQEIDRIPAGRVLDPAPPANFGWAAFDGARDQTNREVTMTGPLSWPVASYLPRGACAVTGGVTVRPDGRASRILGGRYVFGDFCSGRIWSIPTSARAGQPLRVETATIRNQTAYLQDRRGRVLVSSWGGSVFELLPSMPVAR